MKRNSIATLIAAAITFGPAHAINYPTGNVTFNGSLSSTTCSFSLSGQDAVGNTVRLPLVRVSDFPPVTGNVFGGPAFFVLNIKDCNSSMGSLQVMFDGQMDPQGYQQQIFMNTATTNPATDLGLLLLNGNYPGQTNFVLSPGQPSPALALTGGAANLPLMAYYMQTNQAVAPTAGNFFVSTTLNIVY